MQHGGRNDLLTEIIIEKKEKERKMTFEDFRMIRRAIWVLPAREHCYDDVMRYLFKHKRGG